MVQVHPQFITDTVGKKLVVLPLDEFDAMIEELEDLKDVRLYDEAKREDDGSRISLTDYTNQRKARKNFDPNFVKLHTPFPLA